MRIKTMTVLCRAAAVAYGVASGGAMAYAVLNGYGWAAAACVACWAAVGVVAGLAARRGWIGREGDGQGGGQWSIGRAGMGSTPSGASKFSNSDSPPPLTRHAEEIRSGNPLTNWNVKYRPEKDFPGDPRISSESHEHDADVLFSTLPEHYSEYPGTGKVFRSVAPPLHSRNIQEDQG